MRKTVLLLALASFVVFGITAAFGAEAPAPAPAAPAPASPPAKAKAMAAPCKVGDVVPALMGKSLDDKEVDLKSVMTSDTNVLVFFNTVCRSCMGELDALQRLVADKKAAKVTVAAVGVDFAGVPVIKRFKEAKKFSFEVYADPDFSVPIAFGLTMTPSSVVIDKEGKVLAIYGGYDAGVKAKLADLFK